MDFFNHNNMNEAVINVDDFYGRELAYKINLPSVTYAIHDPANSFAIDIEYDLSGTKFSANIIDDVILVNSIMVGEFNVYNLLASMTVAKLLGMTNDEISVAVNNLKAIDGRFNIFKSKNKTVLVDFAHTPDSIEKTLSLVRAYIKGKIITVFGCVGYSDREKRIDMGTAVNKYSDSIILTTDNRGETLFEDICADVLDSIDKDYLKIEDRESAIAKGVSLLDDGDILCVLGKGAENFQKINNERIKYSDIEVVKRLLKE